MIFLLVPMRKILHGYKTDVLTCMCHSGILEGILWWWAQEFTFCLRNEICVSYLSLSLNSLNSLPIHFYEVSVATSYFGSLCGLNVVDCIDCTVEFVALIREGLVTTVWEVCYVLVPFGDCTEHVWVRWHGPLQKRRLQLHEECINDSFWKKVWDSELWQVLIWWLLEWAHMQCGSYEVVVLIVLHQEISNYEMLSWPETIFRG